MFAHNFIKTFEQKFYTKVLLCRIFVKFFDKMVKELYLLIIIDLWTLNERGDSAVKYDELFHLRFNLLQATYQIQQIVITIYLQNIVRGRSKLKTFYILLFWEIIGPLIRIGIVDINSILCTKVLLIFCWIIQRSDYICEESNSEER